MCLHMHKIKHKNVAVPKNTSSCDYFSRGSDRRAVKHLGGAPSRWSEAALRCAAAFTSLLFITDGHRGETRPERSDLPVPRLC